MEEWQKKCITQNLPELILETEFNSLVKAGLLANNILTRAEVRELDAEKDRKGGTSANYKLFEFLLTRVGAYQVLTKILEENQQTGAARILKNGLRNLGIPTTLDGFNDLEIDVQGKLFKIHQFFPAEKLDLAQQIFRDTISEQELYNLFVIKQMTFVLAISNVPPEPPFYVPRFMSNRIVVQESLFKSDCPDVFVFRNTIKRYKLSDIAKPHFTALSSSQLAHITCRFIYLEEYEDWVDLKKSAKVPIHLINFETGQCIYLLEDTSSGLDILCKFGSNKERVYMTEDEFVQQQLYEGAKASSVCICDTPGMGKTFLLSKIARRMTESGTGRIVAYIQLSTFVTDYFLLPKDKMEKQESALLNVFKYVSAEFPELLLELVKAELLQVEIFFDGFDEIPSDKIKWMKEVFLSIKRHLSTARIYITSRPHMRHELEKSLGVIAYDILPFNLQNQRDYLVHFWSSNVPKLDNLSLQNYALRCLKEVNQTLTRQEKAIAGIPLLCHLIAEVYAHKVQFYSKTKSSNMEFTLKIPQMYQQFIEQRIRAVSTNEDEFKDIKLVHCFHALQLLFPEKGFHNDELFKTVNQEMATRDVFKTGIIQFQSKTKLEFLHRTCAEYFVAEYFSCKLLSTAPETKTVVLNFLDKKDGTEKLLDSILNLMLATSENNNMFVNSVIVSFVDFSLNDAQISEEIKRRVASFCASISPESFQAVLCACCRHNFYSLFFLLKEALIKWSLEQKKMYFTPTKCFQLLEVCIRESSSQIFHSCIQLFTEVLKLDIEQIATHDKYNTLLHIAAEAANYEAVEYFLDRVSIDLPSVLWRCVEWSYYNDLDVLMRRENILHLLLNKNPTLIQETSDILRTSGLDLRLFKVLVKLGANLTAVDGGRFALNCAMSAAQSMSPTDYHELVQFLVTECKAEYLFVKNEKWKHPLPHIIKWARLLPETLELLLNIPGNDINMKDEDGENLLFSAAKGNNVHNLKQLVDRGLDYNARGMENRSLLHAAAWRGRVEMVRYLLSLKLDPNSRDQDEWTPLHHAANKYDNLSVVEVLVENGANVHAKDKWGQTALHLSAARDYYSSIEATKYLIGKGVGVNDRDKDGNTPLHLCKEEEAKDCLIKMRADIQAKNKNGQTPAQMNPRLWKLSN